MAFVLLKEHAQPTPDLHKALITHVRQAISPIAAPDVILFTPGLPKTRSVNCSQKSNHGSGEIKV
jgi:acetyl-CoA synthetase